MTTQAIQIANCVTPLNVPRSLTGFSSIALAARDDRQSSRRALCTPELSAIRALPTRCYLCAPGLGTPACLVRSTIECPRNDRDQSFAAPHESVGPRKARPRSEEHTSELQS